MKIKQKEILERIARLDNGTTIKVLKDINPEVGKINPIDVGTSIIEVKYINSDFNDHITIGFSITETPYLKPNGNLEVGVMDILGGHEISGVGTPKLNDDEDHIYLQYEVRTTKTAFQNNNNLNINTPMEEWINENLMDFNFERAPLTTQLMRNYLSCTYGADADYSEYSMMQELQALHNDQQLMLLFIQEMIDNPDGSNEE